MDSFSVQVKFDAGKNAPLLLLLRDSVKKTTTSVKGAFKSIILMILCEYVGNQFTRQFFRIWYESSWLWCHRWQPIEDRRTDGIYAPIRVERWEKRKENLNFVISDKHVEQMNWKKSFVRLGFSQTQDKSFILVKCALSVIVEWKIIRPCLKFNKNRDRIWMLSWKVWRNTCVYVRRYWNNCSGEIGAMTVCESRKQ